MKGIQRTGRALLALGLSMAIGCGDGGDIGQGEMDITANLSDRRAVRSEWMRASHGKYRSVMDSGGCTGTVLGPHAVLTAYHCLKPLISETEYDVDCNPIGSGASRFVAWRNNPLDTGDDLVFEITGNFGNPHAINKKYFLSKHLRTPASSNGKGCEFRPFAPTFWRGRTELPHPHDVAVYFVPGLTQQFIDANGIEIPRLDGIALAKERKTYPDRPYFFPASGFWGSPVYFDYELVGRMGGTNNQRRFGSVHIESPSGSSFLGQLAYGTGISGDVHGNPGDSGGPTFGYMHRFFKPTLQTPIVIAATKSGFHSPSSTTVGSAPMRAAPLAHLPGMSAEQDEAARLNHLWLRARVDDADNDGIPIQCDSDPASPGYDRTSRCPAPDGVPRVRETKGYPQGSLMCDDGFVVTGYRGSETNRGITRLAVLCRPQSCVDASNLYSCSRSYWTDEYGIAGKTTGLRFSEVCGWGARVDGFTGRTGRSSRKIRSMAITCKKGAGGVRSPSHGRYSTSHTRTFHHNCSNGKFVQGVVARMKDRNVISGIQAVCTQ
jgi:hypothetical protein